MNPTKYQRLIKDKRRMKGGRGQERLWKIIEYIKLYVFSSIIFQPRKFNHEGMKIIWRAQVASKFLLNHPKYTIMFASAVVGAGKHFSNFLRKHLKGRITSNSFFQKLLAMLSMATPQTFMKSYKDIIFISFYTDQLEFQLRSYISVSHYLFCTGN